MSVFSISLFMNQADKGKLDLDHGVFAYKGRHANGNGGTANRRYKVPDLYATPTGDRHLRGCMKARV